jgi:hypothetical protein
MFEIDETLWLLGFHRFIVEHDVELDNDEAFMSG